MSPDFINALIHSFAVYFIFLSVNKAYKDKQVKGVSFIHVAFFAALGYWNMFFFNHLEQWWSIISNALIALMNTTWLILLLYYSKYPGGR